MACSRHTTVSPSRWTTPRALAALLLLAAAAAAEGAAMTNEDVVRMAASRLPPDRIIEAIRAAPTTSFDLDPDVVVELLKAGVDDAVIEAMRKAQRTAAPARPESPRALGSVEMIFLKEEGSDPARSTAVTLARDWNDRPTALGFFVACVNPLHVPDLWDRASPLAGSFPRHHLLWFTGETRPHREGRAGAVYLELPDRARFELEEGMHPIEVGVAARAGDLPWEPVARASARIEVKLGLTGRITVKVRTRRADRTDVTLGGRPAVTCEIVEIWPPPGPAAADPNVAPAPP